LEAEFIVSIATILRMLEVKEVLTRRGNLINWWCFLAGLSLYQE